MRRTHPPCCRLSVLFEVEQVVQCGVVHSTIAAEDPGDPGIEAIPASRVVCLSDVPSIEPGGEVTPDPSQGRDLPFRQLRHCNAPRSGKGMLMMPVIVRDPSCRELAIRGNSPLAGKVPFADVSCGPVLAEPQRLPGDSFGAARMTAAYAWPEPWSTASKPRRGTIACMTPPHGRNLWANHALTRTYWTGSALTCRSTSPQGDCERESC